MLNYISMLGFSSEAPPVVSETPLVEAAQSSANSSCVFPFGLLIIAGGVVLVGLIIAIVIIVSKKSRKPSSSEPPSAS